MLLSTSFSVPLRDVKTHRVLLCRCLLPSSRLTPHPSSVILRQPKPLCSPCLAPFPDTSLLSPGLTRAGPCPSGHGAHKATTLSPQELQEEQGLVAPAVQDALMLTELHPTPACFTTAWHCWLIFGLWLMTSSGFFLFFFFCKLTPKPNLRINCRCNAKENFQMVRFQGRATHVPVATQIFGHCKGGKNTEESRTRSLRDTDIPLAKC